MSVAKEQIEAAIKEYIDPYLEKDLVTAGAIKDTTVDGDAVKVGVVLGYPAYGYADKLACGLQQFMAGARKFSLPEITRDDLMAANRETAEETGIAYMTDSLDESAKAIING